MVPQRKKRKRLNSIPDTHSVSVFTVTPHHFRNIVFFDMVDVEVLTVISICLDGQLEPDVLSQDSKMLSLPVVFACEWPAAHNCSSARVDNAKGARLAVDHLCDLGHNHIAHVAGPARNVLTEIRKQATMDALHKRGLKVENNWMFKGDFGLASGVAVAKQWLALSTRPTALFCASDLMAIGIIAELHRQGVSVPDDVSVIGFDDIDIAQYYSPTLTTIRQPTRQLGVSAARALLDKLHGVSTGPMSSVLDVELIARASTAPPRGC